MAATVTGMAADWRIAVAGLGSVGGKVAAALDTGLPGFTLTAVSARDLGRASERVAGFRSAPAVVPLDEIAEQAEIVVECLPPDVFEAVARPILDKGGTLVAASAGALLRHHDLIDLARRRGGRIVVPSGAIAGLDGLRAGVEAGLEDVLLVTRKPPASFGDTVSVDGESLATASIREPVRLFAGSARDAVVRFPVNVNVAAALSLAGLGPDRTRVEVWADPGLDRNRHEISVRSATSAFTATVVNLPDPDNPRSSGITGHSIVAALRRMTDPLVVGS